MPSKTDKQQHFMGLALAIKLGKVPSSKSPAAAKAAREMSTTQLREFAHKRDLSRKGK